MSLLNDAKALVKVRRKVERATDAAVEAGRRHKQAGRQFQPCYPDSTGPTTAINEHPHAVATSAENARWMVQHGSAPVQQPIIDRTPAALRKLHESRVKPADILKSMDMASNRVGQRVGSLNA